MTKLNNELNDLKGLEGSKYILSERSYRRKYPFPFQGLALAEGYIKGRLKVVLCFDEVATNTNVGHAAAARRYFFDLQCDMPGSRVNKLGALDVKFSRRWQDALMLVSDIQNVQLEKLALTSRVGLHFSADKVSDGLGRPITGSYLSIDGTLYGGPILPAEWESTSVSDGMPICFDQDTVSVIKGCPKIVDGIAKRGREMLGWLNIMNGPPLFQRSLLVFGEESFFVIRDEVLQKGFNLTDVLIGPFYLEVGAEEVDIAHEVAKE